MAIVKKGIMPICIPSYEWMLSSKETTRLLSDLSKRLPVPHFNKVLADDRILTDYTAARKEVISVLLTPV